MPGDRPMWRRMFDAVDAPLSKHAQDLTSSSKFAAMLMQGFNTLQSIRGNTRRKMTKLMHFANLPAYADMAKLSRQVGSLTGKVDALSARVEMMTEALEAERAARCRDRRP